VIPLSSKKRLKLLSSQVCSEEDRAENRVLAIRVEPRAEYLVPYSIVTVRDLFIFIEVNSIMREKPWTAIKRKGEKS
jgi:hypothetical protein